MSEDNIKIVICEPSYILRTGIVGTLQKIPGLRFNIHEVNSLEAISGYLKMHSPDVILLNPSQGCHYHFEALRDESNLKTTKFLALESAMTDRSILEQYDGIISLFDSLESIREKLDKILEFEEDSGIVEDAEVLSTREKEILTCVVRGMTNKEIATHLFLSTHTVISHRRNIARKLEIHSTAGLTIYAIVNKLISLEELKL